MLCEPNWRIALLRRWLGLIPVGVVLLVGGARFLKAADNDPPLLTNAKGGEHLMNRGTVTDWPIHRLDLQNYWLLNPPGAGRFDASGLLRTTAGDLLTVNDRGAALYRIEFVEGKAEAALARMEGLFTNQQLAPFAGEKIGRYDCEGIAQDDEGRIFLCEEGNRWVLRWDSQKRALERLNIDWSPVAHYFHPTDRNASFEGIAVAGNRLYLVNERQQSRIIVVDLPTLRVIDDFSVHPRGNSGGDVSYSDLCWFEGHLYVLLRQSFKILRVDPETHRVLAEFHYEDLERRRDLAYRIFLPLGLMEGLAVDHESFWLVIDNNGLGRQADPADKRPTLFRCLRPPEDSARKSGPDASEGISDRR